MELATEIVNVSQQNGLSISFFRCSLLKYFAGGGISHSKIFYNIHDVGTANRRQYVSKKQLIGKLCSGKKTQRTNILNEFTIH